MSAAATLQWGRDRAVAEFHLLPDQMQDDLYLQWGRDRAVAELGR